MKKQSFYQKPSFILIETILSILLLSIVLSSFLSLRYKDKSKLIYKKILLTHNNFNTNNYNKNFLKKNKTIEVLINNSEKKLLDVKEILYKDKYLKLIKYEI